MVNDMTWNKKSKFQAASPGSGMLYGASILETKTSKAEGKDKV